MTQQTDPDAMRAKLDQAALIRAELASGKITEAEAARLLAKLWGAQ